MSVRHARSVVLSLLAALIAVVGLPVSTASASGSLTVDAFVQKYNGGFWDYDGVYGAQCADLFEYYNRDVVGAPFIQFDYAYQLYANFPAPAATYYDRISPSVTPTKGDVAVWNSSLPGSGGAGHVAMVLGVVNATTLQVIQQNAPMGAPTQVGNASTAYLLGYLRPKSLPGGGDGSFLRASDNGEVYRVAGGAPLYVSSWTPFGGSQPVTDVSRAQLNAMPQYPRDGTFVNGQSSGRVYRFAGGSPHYVSTWASFGGGQPTVGVDDFALDHPDNPSPLNHVRAFPVDGAFVSNTADGRVYRIAGGAPLYVSSWANLGGAQPTTSLDPWDFTQYEHLRRVPVDMFLRGLPSNRIFRVVNTGHAYYVPSWDPYGGTQPFLDVDDWAIDNCDHLECGPFGHLDQVTAPAGGGKVQVAGWSIDPNTPALSTEIHVYVGGPAGDPNAEGHDVGTASRQRLDVAAAYPGTGNTHGYDVTVTTAKRGSQPVYVYALNTAGGPGTNQLLGQSNATIATAIVTAAAPGKRDGCGTSKDVYVLPSMAGVDYLVGGALRAAGTYPASGTISITAHARTGYSLTGTTGWTFTYATANCTATLSVPALATPTYTTAKVTPTWSMTGTAYGTKTYTIQRRTVTISNGARVYSAPTTWLSWTAATSGTFTGSSGMVYQFRAQGKDVIHPGFRGG